MGDDEVNLQNADVVCDIFARATEANLNTPGRTGAVVELPAAGHLLVTGDLHDNRFHFDKVVRYARLDRGDDRHIVLQELVHGSRLVNGMDFSYRLLARAALLKTQRPAQVHVLLSNHELAQILGEGILKDSVSVVEAYDEGLEYVFGDDTERVVAAIDAYVRSMPLAVRTGNGMMVSHSVPGPRMADKFDPQSIRRPLVAEDYQRPHGAAYVMVWGRNATQDWLDRLAAAWDVELFVIGHEKAEMGCEDREDTMIVVNSDHAHGAVLPIDLSRKYGRDELIEDAMPLNAL